MSSKESIFQSKNIFFVGILFVLLIFLIVIIFIFSQFFKNNSKETFKNDSTENVFLEKDFKITKNANPGLIDYNFKI